MSAAESKSEPDLRYPIGRFRPPGEITAEERAAWIQELHDLPSNLKKAISGLTEAQLRTPYRPGGWTVLQLIHHLADSHINMYTRVRLALTEEVPTIKPYNEAAWAELPDAHEFPTEPSLLILEGLHARLVSLLRSLSNSDLCRTYRHPELGEMSLQSTIALYAWHSRHHVAHVTELRRREGWPST